MKRDIVQSICLFIAVMLLALCGVFAIAAGEPGISVATYNDRQVYAIAAGLLSGVLFTLGVLLP